MGKGNFARVEFLKPTPQTSQAKIEANLTSYN